MIPKHGHDGPARSWGGLLSGTPRTGKSLCYSHKAGDCDTMRHTTSQMNWGDI